MVKRLRPQGLARWSDLINLTYPEIPASWIPATFLEIQKKTKIKCLCKFVIGKIKILATTIQLSECGLC